MQPIVVSLIITVVGMGLVFVAIILLWGLMELIVLITAKSEESSEQEVQTVELKSEVKQKDSTSQKVKAAAAAVAVALALHKVMNKGAIEGKFSSQMSAWQSSSMATQASQKAAILQRR